MSDLPPMNISTRESSIGLALDQNWSWKSRTLPCKINLESGNPAGDELRKRFADLAGLKLTDLVKEMKQSQSKKKTNNNSTNLSATSEEAQNNNRIKDLLNRAHTFEALKIEKDKIESEEKKGKIITYSKRNIQKTFNIIPKSPAKRILMQIQRERAVPFILPKHQDDLEELVQQNRNNEKRKAQNAKLAASNVQQVNESKVDFRTMLPPYSGDIFQTVGEYNESIIYLSRMKTNDDLHVESGNQENAPLLQRVKSQSHILSPSGIVVLNGSVADNDEIIDENSSQVGHDLVKLNCAATLCKWSRDPANSTRLKSEGAIKAFLQLLNEPDIRIQRFCAYAFRCMSDQSLLATAMIDEGVSNAIADFLLQVNDDFLFHNFALTLVFLTRVNGKEAALVDKAAVLAFQNLVSFRPDFGILSACGLYNLTCVDSQYLYIERVVRSLITLASTASSNVKHICAAALCNLSDLVQVRPRLIEEGVIGILTQFSKASVDSRTRRVCAVLLQNLSASKQCRIDMVSKGCIIAAFNLSTDQDPVILRSVALTVGNLASETSNCSRIVSEKGITALCNIASKNSNIPGISRSVAVAFQLLSSNVSIRSHVINEYGIVAIAGLLTSSYDLLTLQFSLLALCDLLCDQESHSAIISQGLIHTIMDFTRHEDHLIKDYCALVFLHLSADDTFNKYFNEEIYDRNEDMQPLDDDSEIPVSDVRTTSKYDILDSISQLVYAGCVKSIVKLVGSHCNLSTKRKCAAIFCYMTRFSNGLSRMVSDGIIPSLISLISLNDIDVICYSCTALCRLCCSELNGELILNENIIPLLVKHAKDGDAKTRPYCGAVLSALSFYSRARISLIENNVLEILKLLSTTKNNTSKQHCLVAYANLSYEASVQEKMMSDNVVEIISSLAESYQEFNYLCAAKAICNISCSSSLRLSLAQQGGIRTLLMICMVHSVDVKTKSLCVNAFLNVLGDDTVNIMLQEGIIGSIINLSKAYSSYVEITLGCSQLLNKLSFYASARSKLVDKKSYLHMLFSLGEMKTIEDKSALDLTTSTSIIIARTCCNLIIANDPSDVAEDICVKVVDNGAIQVLLFGINQDIDLDTKLQCLKSLYRCLLLNNHQYASLFASTTSLIQSLIQVSRRYIEQIEILSCVFKLLLVLVSHEDSRVYLQQTSNIESFLSFLQQQTLSDEIYDANTTISLILGILKYLLVDNSHPIQLIRAGYVNVLFIIFNRLKSKFHGTPMTSDLTVSNYMETISEILRLICEFEEKECLDALSGIQFIDVLHVMTSLSNSKQMMYHLSVVIYTLLSRLDEFYHRSVGTTQLVNLLYILGQPQNKTSELFVASAFILLSDVKCRYIFATLPIVELLKNIIIEKPDRILLYNTIQTISFVSKLPKCRELLVKPPIEIENHINEIMNSTEDSKLKHLCSKVLKNVSIESSNAIEEGAVANLISTSLDSRYKVTFENISQSPHITPLLLSDDNHLLDRNIQIESWFVDYEVVYGGIASIGPAPELPAKFSVYDHIEQIPWNNGKVDQEPENRSKMALAKMQIPKTLRDEYFLKDEDFFVDMQEDSEVHAVDVDDLINIEPSFMNPTPRSNGLVRGGDFDVVDSDSESNSSEEREEVPVEQSKVQTVEVSNKNKSSISETNSKQNNSVASSSLNKSSIKKKTLKPIEFSSTSIAQKVAKLGLYS